MLVVLGLILIATGAAQRSLAADRVGPPALTVVGKQLQSAPGKVMRLRGVNIPSLEWGPGDHLLESLRVASEDWGANLIRLPLSQDRWFGHGRESRDAGAGYRQTVREFVHKAAARGCYVILDLHWSDTGTWGANIGQHSMPDDHSAEFWTAAAAAYANHPAVLLGLYNEPHDVSWEVWRNGGKVIEKDVKAPRGRWEYHSPGMQKLLDVCRAQGARNIVVAGGLDWGYDLSGVVAGYALADPTGNGVLYDTHIYPWKKQWDRCVSPAAQKYPVLAGEFGVGSAKEDEPQRWLSRALRYFDVQQLHWSAWCLHPGAQPCLIRDWQYTPTPVFGATVKKALRAATTAR